MIASPFFMLFAIWLVGWNEKRTVCYARAIEAGEEAVTEVGCLSSDVSGATVGGLVLFTCDLSPTGLSELTVSGDFSGHAETASICLKATSQMYQCVEQQHTQTQGNTTVTTYTYSKQWRAETLSNGFHTTTSSNFQQNCGTTNPGWPSSFPKSSTQTAPTAKAGSWTLPRVGFLDSVPCSSSFEPSSHPAGWTRSGGWYQSGGSAIGAKRIKFETNDWNNPTVTVLGAKTGSDTIEQWTSPDSWLCSGKTLGELRAGTVSKSVMFENMKSENRALKWTLRIIGFGILWAAWDCLGRPCEVAADCIPYIGPCLGDVVEAIVCCVSCIPATACCMFVAGIVWCAMRPMVGGPLLCLAFLSFGGLIAFFAFSRAKKKEAEDGPTANAGAPQAIGNPQMVAAQPQIVQQPQMIQPQMVQQGPQMMQTPDGQMMMVNNNMMQTPDGQQGEMIGQPQMVPMQMMQMPNGQVVYVQPMQPVQQGANPAAQPQPQPQPQPQAEAQPEANPMLQVQQMGQMGVQMGQMFQSVGGFGRKKSNKETE